MKPNIIAPLFVLLIASCGRETETSVTLSEPASPELQAIFVDVIPEEPKAIHIARTDATPGDEIVVKGQIMGALEPFVDGRAAFILGDRAKLTPCNERPGDRCQTPWDNCCDSAEDLRLGTATIQIVDQDGRVLREGVEGLNDLNKLTKIVVQGEVADSSTSGNLVVNAAKIQIVD